MESAADPATPSPPPIIEAAMSGDYDEIYHILSLRPGVVNDADEDDSTALICSAVGGYLDIVKLLLDRSADPDKQDKIGGYTALILATKYSYIDIVRTLVQRGADTEIKDFEGNAAKAYARVEEVKKILARVSSFSFLFFDNLFSVISENYHHKSARSSSKSVQSGT